MSKRVANSGRSPPLLVTIILGHLLEQNHFHLRDLRQCLVDDPPMHDQISSAAKPERLTEDIWTNVLELVASQVRQGRPELDHLPKTALLETGTIAPGSNACA